MGLNENGVTVAMSGGVDSSVAAKLLRDKGYDVSCVYFIMSDAHIAGEANARTVSEQLGLPFLSMDLREDFNSVIDYFCREYCEGRTPNPCVVCNPTVKFKALCEAANSFNSKYIATGHYARVEKRGDIYALRKAACLERDQSYMLYSLTDEQLSRLILPLGELTKVSVRETAEKTGLISANAPDSQEICFIPDGDYPAYINSRGYFGKKGSFIAPEGGEISKHLGVEHYTVGQRKGLRISLGKPVFIRQIRSDGDILLGYSGEEYSSGVVVNNCRLHGNYPLVKGTCFTVKLRSAARPAACIIGEVLPNGFTLIFSEPQRAPAPGQAAVIYDGEYLVGGGIISECF